MILEGVEGDVVDVDFADVDAGADVKRGFEFVGAFSVCKGVLNLPIFKIIANFFAEVNHAGGFIGGETNGAEVCIGGGVDVQHFFAAEKIFKVDFDVWFEFLVTFGIYEKR